MVELKIRELNRFEKALIIDGADLDELDEDGRIWLRVSYNGRVYSGFLEEQED